MVASIETFTDAKECVEFLDRIKKEKAFMIVSGPLGRQVVPDIENIPRLESIMSSVATNRHTNNGRAKYQR